MSGPRDPSFMPYQESLFIPRVSAAAVSTTNGRRVASAPMIDDDEESIRIVPSLSSASHHSRSNAPVILPTIQSYVSKHQAHQQHRRSLQSHHNLHHQHHRGPHPSAAANPSEPPPPTAESEVCSPDTPHQLHVAQQAGNAARERFDMLQRTSQLTHQPTDLVMMSWDDVFVEELLGVGGFACVCLVTCPKLWKKHKRTYLQRKWNNSQHQHSGDLASVDSSLLPPSEDSWMSSSVETNEEKYYACKCLSSRTVQQGYREGNGSPIQDNNGNPGAGSRNVYSAAAADLVGEAFLLSKLCHPNIVRLYGVTGGDIDQAFLNKGGFFLIMEALTSVLDDMLQAWRNLKQGQITSVGDFLRQSTEQIPRVEERLAIALEIAKGMEYCHSQRIIFRDLKPHNVGTDRGGGLRLFDFGLARESPSGVCRGKAGSLRYMAPETIANKFTCYASDVYAFGILMWELMSLERPPNHNNELWNNPQDFERAVCLDGFRPPLNEHVIENEAIRELISNCWQEDFQHRPTFTKIIGTLQELLINQGDRAYNNRSGRSNYRASNRFGDDGDSSHMNGQSRNSLGSSFRSLMNDSLMTDGSHSKMSAITMESARPGRARWNNGIPLPPPHGTVEPADKGAMSPPPPRPPKGPRKAPMPKSESETTVTISNTARQLQTVQKKVGSMRSIRNNESVEDCSLNDTQQQGGLSMATPMPWQIEKGDPFSPGIRERVPKRWYSDQDINPDSPMKHRGAGPATRPPVFVRAQRKTVAGGASVASGTSEGTSGSRSSFASSHGSADMNGTVASGSSGGSPISIATTPTLKGAIQWQRRRKPLRPPSMAQPNQNPRSHSSPMSLMDAMMNNNNKH